MKLFIKAALFLATIVINPVFAQDKNPTQDPKEIQKVAETFITQQLKDRYTKVKVTVNEPDARLKFPPCEQLSSFLPQSGKLIGRTTIGVRCSGPKQWSLYLAANIEAYGNYLIAATPVSAGKIVEITDLAVLEGELSQLPPTVLTDVNQAVGQITASNLAAGLPLRKEMLKAQPGVIQGQTVRVVVKGMGFQITAEGRALQTAQEGQIVNIKLDNGQNVSGTARKGGIVEVSN